LQDEPGIDERREVVRQRRRREAEVLPDVAHPQPVVASLHKQAEDGKAGVVAKSCEGAGLGTGGCHANQHNDKSGYVDSFASP
jgi:hypothetical protein